MNIHYIRNIDIFIVVYPHLRCHHPFSGSFKSALRFYKTSVTIGRLIGILTPDCLNLHRILCAFKSKNLQDHCINLKRFNKPRRVTQKNPTRFTRPLDLQSAFNLLLGRILKNWLVPQGKFVLALMLYSSKVFDTTQAHSRALALLLAHYSWLSLLNQAT